MKKKKNNYPRGTPPSNQWTLSKWTSKNKSIFKLSKKQRDLIKAWDRPVSAEEYMADYKGRL